ncbi:MAG: hypothetical protein ACREM2_06835 [Vulcanimicrobiaceae bacterium]
MVTEAYRDALAAAAPSGEFWARFVRALERFLSAYDGCEAPPASEAATGGEDRDFFAQIVAENRDLLEPTTVAA